MREVQHPLSSIVCRVLLIVTVIALHLDIFQYAMWHTNGYAARVSNCYVVLLPDKKHILFIPGLLMDVTIAIKAAFGPHN